MNKFLFIASLLFLSACSQPSIPLPTKSNFFSDKELNSLSAFVESYDSLLRTRYGNKELPIIYEKLRIEALDNQEKHESLIVLPFEDLHPLFMSLDRTTRFKIWEERSTIFNRRIPNLKGRNKFPDTLSIHIINPDLPYDDFLKEQAPGDPFLTSYVKAITEFGYRSLKEFYLIYIDEGQIDYHNKMHRLIIAINAITRSEASVIFETSQKELMDGLAEAFEERRRHIN